MVDWNDETIDQLRALWETGMSAGAIGREMGISKNAVVGKAHRLNLPPRPSPISGRASDQPLARKHPTARVPTPGLKVPQGSQSLQGDTLSALGVVAAPSSPPTQPATKNAEVVALKTIFRARPAGQCQWPLGSGKPWTFCCAATTPGRSYCEEHASLAYVKFKAFVAINHHALRAKAEELLIAGAKTEPLAKILAEVNRRRSSRGQSEFSLPGMSEPAAAASAGAAF